MPKLVSTNSVALDEASNAFVSRSTWTCEETLKVYVWISMKYRWAFINIMTLYFIYCRDESDPLLHDARLTTQNMEPKTAIEKKIRVES